jgi:hypothetical protein
MEKKRARLNVHQLSRTHRQAVMESLDEAMHKAKTNHQIAGCIIILVDHNWSAEIATAGRLNDPAQAVYHTLRSLNLDFLHRSSG